MWRFLFAGLVTVGGVVLLFVASFGDPSAALREVRSMLPVVQMQPNATPVASPATPTGVTPALTPGPDVAAMQRERDDLQQRLQGLQANVAQATQHMTSLRNEADAARRELEAVRQKQAADQVASEQARQEAQRELEASQQRAAAAEKQLATLQATDHSAPDQARQAVQRELEASQQRAAAAEKQLTTLQASDQARQAVQRELEASQQRAATAEKQLAAQQAALDRLKTEGERAKAPAAPPQDVKPSPAARAEPPAATKLAANEPPPLRPPPAAKPAQATSALPEAVLNRLRQSPATPRGQAEQAASYDRSIGPDGPVDSRLEPRAAPPRERLFEARSALASGRIDEARSLLEQAQVQLVLRPVGPSDTAPATSSMAAGQIAEALSMLGAGDVPRAMQYINLAMAQAGGGQAPRVQAVTAVAPPREAPPPPLPYRP
jgi:hypothetical protein